MNSRIQNCLTQLEQSYDHSTWHGPNLKNSLRGLSLAAALYRPQASRHNIWELMLHCAYWKYVVIQRLSGNPQESFSRSPANFPKPPKIPTQKLWQEDLALLEKTHLLLLKTVAREKPKHLNDMLGSEFTRADTILGAANHDVYHAGQVRLLRRMHADSLRQMHAGSLKNKKPKRKKNP